MKFQLLGGDALTLQVPGIPTPIHLRRQDLPIFDQVLVGHEIDLEVFPQFARVHEIYEEMLATGRQPVILDCGGHVGFSALWFATRFPFATVYSIEPEAANFRLLQQNVASYPKVVAVRGGLWSRHCPLEILNPEAGSAAFRVREAPAHPELGAAEEIPGYTVEEILRTDKDNRLWLVKIDVEGAEAEVFRGPARWLGQAAAIVIELHDWLLPGQGTSGNFLKHVAEHDFEMVQRGENLLLFRSAGRVADPAPESAAGTERELAARRARR